MNLFKSFSKRDQTSSIRKKRLTIALSPLLIGACLFVLARLNGHFADETALKERGTVTMGSVVGYDEGAHRVWYEFEFLHDRYRGYTRVDNASFNTAFETGNIGVVYLKEAPTINSVYNSINQVDLWVMIPFFSLFLGISVLLFGYSLVSLNNRNRFERRHFKTRLTSNAALQLVEEADFAKPIRTLTEEDIIRVRKALSSYIASQSVNQVKWINIIWSMIAVGIVLKLLTVNFTQLPETQLSVVLKNYLMIAFFALPITSFFPRITQKSGDLLLDEEFKRLGIKAPNDLRLLPNYLYVVVFYDGLNRFGHNHLALLRLLASQFANYKEGSVALNSQRLRCVDSLLTYHQDRSNMSVFLVTVLKSTPFFGDQSTLRSVESVAEKSKLPEVREAATAILPALRERVQKMKEVLNVGLLIPLPVRV